MRQLFNLALSFILLDDCRERYWLSSLQRAKEAIVKDKTSKACRCSCRPQLGWDVDNV